MQTNPQPQAGNPKSTHTLSTVRTVNQGQVKLISYRKRWGKRQRQSKERQENQNKTGNKTKTQITIRLANFSMLRHILLCYAHVLQNGKHRWQRLNTASTQLSSFAHSDPRLFTLVLVCVQFVCCCFFAVVYTLELELEMQSLNLKLKHRLPKPKHETFQHSFCLTLRKANRNARLYLQMATPTPHRGIVAYSNQLTIAQSGWESGSASTSD